MPAVPNDKSACEARHNALADKLETGIKTSNRVVSANSNDEKPIARIADSIVPDGVALQAAVANYFGKGLTPMTAASQNVGYSNSMEVIGAIKAGKITKKDAISYVEKFKLIDASKIDDLTPSKAFELLMDDVREATIHETVVAEQSAVEVGSDSKNKGGEKVHHENQPTPDGKANPSAQFPSTDPSDKAISLSDASPEEKGPKPDGSADPHKFMSHDVPTHADEVNKSKPEDKKPAPIVVGQQGTVDPKGQMPSTPEVGKGASGTPEENQPKPQGTVDPKGQMPSTPASPETGVSASPEGSAPEADKKAQMMPPMPKPPMEKPMDAEPMGGPKPPLGLGGLDKPKHDHKAPEMGKGTHVVDEIKQALELLIDVTELIDGHNFNIKKKKEKGEGGGSETPEGEKKDAPKLDSGAPKGEDKPKESPFPKKKEDAPPVMAYKVELVKDEKAPLNSYYIASLQDKPLFSIALHQAFKDPSKKTTEFYSPKYAELLSKELNAKGAQDVFKNVFASRGVVLAQAMDGLPENKFEQPAKPMGVTPEVSQDIGNNDSQSSSFVEMMLDVAAPIIASKDGATAQEFVDQFRDVFSDETKSKMFEGRLSEKVESSKKSADKGNTPDVYNKDTTGAPPPVAPNAGEAAPAMKPEEMKAAASLIQNLPKIKAALVENAELKKQVEEFKTKEAAREKELLLKARMTSTIELAQRKATAGLIAAQDVREEALRLAKLQDADLNKEVQIFENSLKMAKTLSEKKDSTIVEGTTKTANAVLTAIPNQQMDVQVPNKIKWSVGYTETN